MSATPELTICSSSKYYGVVRSVTALDIPVFISEPPAEDVVGALVQEVVSADEAPNFLTTFLLH